MPVPPVDATQESHLLIARFLARQGYAATLDSFLSEAASKHPQLRLHVHAERHEGEDWNDLVEDYIARKVSQVNLDDADSHLERSLNSLQLKSSPLPQKVRTVIKEATNVLNVRSGTLPMKQWDSASLEFKSQGSLASLERSIASLMPTSGFSSKTRCIFTTTVDRTLKIWSSPSRATSSRIPLELLESHSFPSPVLSFVQHSDERYSQFVTCGTMEGSLNVLDLVTREKVVQLRDHNKYIVRVVWSRDGRFLATLGYDKLIHVYSTSITPATSDSDSPTISLSLAHKLHPRTNPEAAVFLPDSSHLVWTQRDDHLLHYLALPSPADSRDENAWRLSEYNMNPNQDSFTSFSILSLSVHPTLPLLSLQTSTTSARVFLYPFHSATRLRTIHTGAAQSDYFNPRHTWTRTGDQVVVNSEDGIVRVCGLGGGVERLKKGCHGIAAPLGDDEEEDGVDGTVQARDETDEVKSERAKARRERDRGSSVVRDVEIVDWSDDEGGWAILSAGFDKTVRMIV
ncbi:hypothetical protein JCM11491_006583 [Sporobolomyces phaffii]